VHTDGVPLETDPIDLLLTSSGDLDTSAGLRFSAGRDAVAQGLRLRVLKFRGEWFLNRDEGVPYLANDVVDETESILGQKFNDARARAAFRDVILAAPGVESLLSLTVTFDRSTRILGVSWKVRTVFGDTIEDTLSPEA